MRFSELVRLLEENGFRLQKLLRAQGLPVPPANPSPTIVVKNERKLEPA